MTSREIEHEGASGHRIESAPSGFAIDAWGPSSANCVTEALSALVEEFAELLDPPSTTLLPLTETKGAGDDALVQLLDEVIDALDVFSVIPVRFHLSETEDGGIAGDMEVVSASVAKLVGSKPKAVSYHDLSLVQAKGSWRCHVIIET